MNDLLNKKCIPCEGGILPFDISEIHKYQKKVDGWDVNKNEKKIYFLKKILPSRTLLIVRIFINKVSEISEAEESSPRYILWMGVCKNCDHYSCNRWFIRK